MLGFLMQNYKINCLKFSNNDFEKEVEAEEIRKIIEKEGISRGI